MPPSRPAIVLVRPRNPTNIGAAARVMANFGFKDLRIVSPFPPMWEEARRSGVGAGELLSAARVFTSLEDALADRRFVWGTSSMDGRTPSRALRYLPGLKAAASSAILFGQEKTGLTKDELSVCDGIVSIPTDSGCPSMNLAQAVAVVCYEISRFKGAPPAPARRLTGAEFGVFLKAAENALERVGYRPAAAPQQRRERLESLFRRRGVSPDEAGFLREIFRRIDEL